MKCEPEAISRPVIQTETLPKKSATVARPFRTQLGFGMCILESSLMRRRRKIAKCFHFVAGCIDAGSDLGDGYAVSNPRQGGHIPTFSNNHVTFHDCPEQHLVPEHRTDRDSFFEPSFPWGFQSFLQLSSSRNYLLPCASELISCSLVLLCLALTLLKWPQIGQASLTDISLFNRDSLWNRSQF